MSNQPQAHVADERAAFDEAYRSYSSHPDWSHSDAACDSHWGKLAGHIWRTARAAIPAGADAAKAAADLLACVNTLEIDIENTTTDALTAFDRTRSRLQKALAAGAPSEPSDTLFEPIHQREEDNSAWRDTSLLGMQAWMESGKRVRTLYHHRVVKSRAADAPAETPKLVAAAISYWQGRTDLSGNPLEPSIRGWGEYEPTTLKHGMAIAERSDKDKRVKYLYDAAQPAPAPATDARDGERLDLIETLVKENGYCYIHQNRSRYDLIGLGLLGETLRESLDALALRRAAMLSANPPREAG